MLRRLTTDASGLAAYLDEMANDPCGYLDGGTARNCGRLARLLHRVSNAADVLDLKMSAIRRTVVATIKSLRVDVA